MKFIVKNQNKLFFGIALLFICGLLNAQDLTSKIPINPKVKSGQLANGLKYFIVPNKKPEKKIELRLVVNAGSILEDNDQLGLAHFMEHMNFNGLKHFPHNDLVHYLQSIGVAFGADLNAYTSFEETVYILPVPGDNKNKVDSAFIVLADWSGNSLLDTSEIDKERGVVLEESRLGKGAEDRMLKKWLPLYMNGSLYGERLPIGKDEILKNFKYEAVKRFHRDWYRPNLQCVIVVGDIDPIEAERQIKEKFSAFKNPSKERIRPEIFNVPDRTTSEARVFTDPEASSTVLQIMGSSFKYKQSITSGDFRNDLIENLFNTLMSGRYDELKNSANPPFVYGGAYIGPGFARSWKDFSAFAVCGSDNIKEATMALVRESMRIKTSGFTEAELTRAKASLMSNYESLYNERDKTESRRLTTEIVGHFLNNEPIPGIEWEYNFAKQTLPGITLADINSQAKKINIDTKYFALITGKPSEKLPSDAELKAWVDAAIKEKTSVYKEETIASSLLTNPPVSGKITKEEKNEKLGITIYTLSNGAKVWAKSTDFKNDQILLKAQRFGGSSLYEGMDYQSADYSNNAVEEMGYGKFSNTDLRKFLSGKVVKFDAWLDNYTDNLQGSASNKDLETMFQLMYLKCTSPRIDETSFKSYVSREKQGSEAYKMNPQYLFMDTSHFVMHNKHPRAHVLPVASDFDKIDMNHAIQYYKERMGSAYGMNYFIVGSFKENELRPLIETYIGGMPGNVINTKYKDLNIDPVKGKNNFTLRKGKEEKSLINIYLYDKVLYDVNDELHVRLLADIINNKITDTLREKMGGIYGGGINLSISKFPKESYIMSSQLPCGPQNVEKLEKAFWGILESSKKPGGISKEDLKKVSETAILQYKEKVKTNEYWQSIMSRYLLWDIDLGRILTYEERVGKVTPEKLVETANKYLNSENVFKALWLPE